ncbi:MAG: HDOD domain-containing protein [bacterium]|nr:HDOD domain-containing protein [bacterium]
MVAETETLTDLGKIVELVNHSDISSIKQTVSQIISTINDPASSAKDLKMIIEIDPPLTAKLLRLANSAKYGYPKTISEIQEAIICIGFDAVRELALSQKVCELFENDTYISGYSRASLWKHSVGVALCSKLIYRREFKQHGNNIYVAGLLHDIGIIVLDQFFHDKFILILKKAYKHRINCIEIENDILGFDHTDIARALAENWEFPNQIIKAIDLHHDPEFDEDESDKIPSVIYLADSIAQDLLIGYNDAPNINRHVYSRCLKKLNIKSKAVDLISKEAAKEINDMKKAGWF